MAPFLFLLAPAGFATTVPAAPDPFSTPVFLSIPETGVLRHAQARLSGDMLYFNTSEINLGSSTADTAAAQNFNYASDLSFGFENRAELSFQFGTGFSMGLKTLLLEEDIYVPGVVFGIRDLFQSQEGTLYGSPDSVERRLRGESYLGLAKRLSQNTRLHLGGSLLNGANKSAVGFYGGFQWNLGAGALGSYEVFERFNDFHQLLGLSWRFGNIFSMTVAFAEFQSWIRQDGEWGFFTAPSRVQNDGYNSPGIRFALSVFAFVPKTDRRTLPERVADLEKKNQADAREMDALKGRLATQKMEQEAMRRAVMQLAAGGRGGPALEGPAADFRLLAELYKSENADPTAVRAQVDKVVAHKDKIRPILEKAAQDTLGAEESRVAALLAMGSSQDSVYGTTLAALCRDRSPRVRREAVTALTRVKPKAVEAAVSPLLKDPDEAVALTARTVLQEMGAASVESGAKPPPAGKPQKSK